MSAFADHMLFRFDESLTDHLEKIAPREAQALGRDGLRAIVTLARQRAAKSGLTHRECIRLYLDLMFLLGSGFATDPQYPWAAAALAPAGEQDQAQRLGNLHAAAIEYAHTVLGPKRDHLSSALERLSMHRLQDFLRLTPFPESLIEKLVGIFPEKVDYVGSDRIRTLLQSAHAAAQRHSLSGEAAVVLLTILMFLLGHEVDQDPIIPWVGSMLNNSALIEPSARIEMLENKTWEELRNGVRRVTSGV